MLPSYPTPPTTMRDGPAVAAIIALDRGIYRVARHWLLAVNAVLFAWIALAVLAPILTAAGYPAWGRIGYAIFSPFCHQRDDRSFHILGEKMACCERCAAIYGGLLLFGIAYTLLTGLRPLSWTGWSLLSLPILLDAGTQTIGLRDSNAVARVLTGALFAIGVAWLFLPYLDRGFADMRAQLERRFARLVAQGRARPLRGAPATTAPR